MSLTLKRIGFTAATVAFTLTMVACHGQSPGGAGYMPAGSTTVSMPQTGGGFAPDAKHKIVSTCGKRVHIVLLGILDCRFREQGYGNGTFTITNDVKGIVIVTPSSGTQETKFTVLGALLGNGHFIVKDSKGHKLKVTVKVTL